MKCRREMALAYRRKRMALGNGMAAAACQWRRSESRRENGEKNGISVMKSMKEKMAKMASRIMKNMMAKMKKLCQQYCNGINEKPKSEEEISFGAQWRRLWRK
jgi:type IV secretory pathway TrbL component